MDRKKSPRLSKEIEKRISGPWLPDLIVEAKDDDLVQLVLYSLNFDKKLIRAFAVALLENNDDEEVAREINDILIANPAEDGFTGTATQDPFIYGPAEDEPLDSDGLP